MKKTVKSLLCILCFALCAIIFCSCGSAGSSYYESDSKASDKILYSESSDEESGTDLTERKIIRTVNETVETDSFDSFMSELEKNISAAGGYSVSKNVNGNGYGEDKNRTAHLTVYIPAENLDDFTGAIGNIGVVTYYSEDADDVTEAYVDVTSRISVLEAEEKTLLAMLEKTESISDMLSVREQLTEVQEDLASLRAQKKSYDQRVAYSTVYLTVYEEEYVTEEEESFFAAVGRTFMNSLRGLGTFLRYAGIAIFGGLPYILFFVGIPLAIILTIYFVGRKKKNKLKKQKAEATSGASSDTPKA